MGIVSDRVRDTTTSTGTGNLTLAGAAPTGFETFNTAFGVGPLFFYCIFSDGGAEWEVGEGSLSAATTLVRNTVYASSNGDALVNFSAGTKNVFVTVPAGAFGEGGVRRIAGASGAAGFAPIVLQRLTADAAANSTTTLAVVMTTTGVGPGLWRFSYMVRYHSAATTTGIGLAVNHSGTTGVFLSQSRFVSTGGAAATGVADQVAATVVGQLVEGKSERVKNTASSATAGVDTAAADCLIVLDGMIEVTVAGQLELKASSEVAASAITVKAFTLLELKKVS